MSSRRLKRRRIDKDADPVHEERHSGSISPVYDPHEADKVANDPEPAEEPPTEGIDFEVFAKEVEIWDAFREEQNEILEQLPLSLHRVFKLIHELDSQAQVRISNVTPAILKYVSLRRTLADVNKEHGEAHSEPQTSDSNGISKLSNGSSLSPPPASTPGPTSTRGRTTPVPPGSLAAIVESSNSTRELLINIAQSAEEISRASNEKYHLARHVYDLVDRYIHDLDRAIKEQEASISLGLRPGTHPASIILPELVIPKANRSRVIASSPPIEISIEPIVPPEPVAEPEGEEGPVPAPEEGEEGVEVVERSPPPEVDVELVEIVEDSDPLAVEAVESTTMRRKRKGRKRRQSTRARTEPAPVEHEDLASEESMGPELEGEEPEVEHQPSLKLKIPAQNVGPPLSEGEVPDPNEPRYCFCNQVSYGEMIACDNLSCTREWFHMGCVGVTKTPKGKWYCRECIDLVKRSKGKKRQR